MASGFFKVDRDIWVDPQFDEEKFTKREAWMWLTSKAAYKLCTRTLHQRHFELERGQLVASVRFLAEAWKWKPATVHRYLQDLGDAQRITVSVETGISLITICNFEEFSSRTATSETETEQQRDSHETNHIKERNKEESEEGAGSRITSPIERGQIAENKSGSSEHSIDLYHRLVSEALNSSEQARTHRASAELLQKNGIFLVESWRNDLGLSVEQVIGVIREVLSKVKTETEIGSLNYFTKAMQRFAAKRTRQFGQSKPTCKPPKKSSKIETSDYGRSETAPEGRERSQATDGSKKAVVQRTLTSTAFGLTANRSNRLMYGDLSTDFDLSPAHTTMAASKLEGLPRNHPQWRALEAARNQNELAQQARADQERLSRTSQPNEES